MNFIEFKDEFSKSLKKFDINLTELQMKKFYEYMQLLIEWNEKINLTAIIEPKDIIIKHFVDSLTISKYIKDEMKIIDIGTGAGFPGIPIKIKNEKVEITLMDALNKRINFLEEVIKKNNLKNIETLHGRAEEFGKNTKYREKYDMCITRAVAKMNILVEYMMPFIKKDGICICMKGIEVEEELEKSKNAIKELGGKIEQIDKLTLLENENNRNIIVIKKISETPEKYPRKMGIIKKNPL